MPDQDRPNRLHHHLLHQVRRSILRDSSEFISHLNAALDRVDRTGVLFSFINNFSYRVARRDARFQHVDFFGADGLIFALILRLLTGRKIERASFDTNSVAIPVLETCCRRRVRIGVVGGTEEEINVFGRKLSALMPDLQLAALVAGFDVSSEEVSGRLREAQVEVAVFSMGSGRQEAYAAAALNTVSTLRAAFTSGAFVSQFSRTEAIGIYPDWVNRWNLRWAYRLLREPHVRKRVAVDYPLSFVEIAIDMAARR